MGHPLRPLVPGTEYFVTVNCSERRFFLRPDAEITEWVAYWLARANRRHPRILIEGVVVMSNHIHLLLLDRSSSLSSFMAYFLGNLAKSLNRQRRRQGRAFERRFASAPVLDDAAQADRLAYLIDNPVKAGLVGRFEDWPGLLVWSQDGCSVERPVHAFDRAGYEQAFEEAGPRGPKPQRQDYEHEETLYVHPAQTRDDDGCPPRERAEHLAKLVRARQQEHANTRRARGEEVLGARQARAQDWRRAPAKVQRSPRPICHAGTEPRRRQFAQWWRALREVYVEASVAFRAGEFGVAFPEHTFRPSAGFVEADRKWLVAA